MGRIQVASKGDLPCDLTTDLKFLGDQALSHRDSGETSTLKMVMLDAQGWDVSMAGVNSGTDIEKT